MRKTMRILLCALVCVIFFTGSAGASGLYTYRDDFMSAANTPEKVYSNIRPYIHPANPSISYGTFAARGDQQRGYSASVTYKLSGSWIVEFGIYSSVGTLVQNVPGVGWTLVSGKSPSMGDALLPAVYGIGDDGRAGIYAQIDSTWHILGWDDMVNDFRFAASASAPGGTKFYGVNVYADGRPISIYQTSITRIPHPVEKCYEEFIAIVPFWVSNITIEINDVFTVAADQQRAVGLAFVEFTLQDVTTPEPEPSQPPTSPRPPTPSPSGAVSSPRPASSSSRSSSSGSASSSGYFVGSPMPLSSRSSSTAPRGSSSPSANSMPSAAGTQSEPPPQQSENVAIEYVAAESVVTIHRTERPRESNHTPAVTGMAVLGLLAIAALAAVVLSGRKK